MGSRSKPILIACGCLTAFVLFMGGIGFFVMRMIRTSEPATAGVLRAARDRRVITELGEPVETGWFVMGSFETSGSSGNAAINIPLSGPRASGKLNVVATQEVGAWHMEVLVLDVGGKRIDLLSDDETASAASSVAARSSAVPVALPKPSTPPPAGTIVDGPVRVTGSLSADRVKAVVHGCLEAIRGCYSGGLAKDPSLSGTIALTFVVDEMGRVREATNVESTLRDHDVVDCAMGQLQHTTFPPPERGKATVKYTLIATPAH